MGLILVSGISGAGKSTLKRVLLARGHRAFGISESGLAAWHDTTSGAPVTPPSADGAAPEEWLDQHAWRLSRRRIQEFAERTQPETVFVCGAASNEHEVWTLFDAVVYLWIDADTMRRRVAERIGNDFGKAPHELDRLIGWLGDARTLYERAGAIIIDARQPIDAVADQVEAASRPTRHAVREG
jgi:hypothetical protein